MFSFRCQSEAQPSMRLCTPGVTDVRRNVWVLRSLLRVSAESCHSAPLHPPTPPLPASSAYTSTSPPAEAAGWEAKWCETGELPDKLHYSSSENSPQPACQRRVDGPGPGGSMKAGAKSSFHLWAAFHVFILLSSAACSFALARLRPCMFSSRDCGERSRTEKEKCHGETGILLVSIHPGRVPFGS